VAFDMPVLASINWAAAGLTVLALVAVFRFRLGMATVLGGAALAGLALGLLGLT
jgi:chromate transporter